MSDTPSEINRRRGTGKASTTYVLAQGHEGAMKILFLHGWTSKPGGVKPTFLASRGHEVLNPALPDEDFAEAVRIAQAEYDRCRPEVIVGSSRGGAVAMNVRAGGTPLVLLCPAWKNWGTERTVEAGTVILHSEQDDVIPIEDSRELVRVSGLPESALIVVGNDHRLADEEALEAMLAAVERSAAR
jgi:alpha-beta hydrolase superfamily lysophospholipase